MDAVFFAYSWKLPAYSVAFLLTIDNFSFFAYNWSFFAYSFSFFTYNWSFFAYSGKVRLIKALRNCKQRSLTVSKKTPTVSKKLPQFSRDLSHLLIKGKLRKALFKQGQVHRLQRRFTVALPPVRLVAVILLEVGRDRSRIIHPFLIVPKHS